MLFLDVDPQASASEWTGLREETPFAVLACARANPNREAARRRDRCDHILINGLPRGDAIVRSCLAAADLAAVPIEPSGLSARASNRIVELIHKSSGLNCKPASSSAASERARGSDARCVDLATGLPVLRTEIDVPRHSDAVEIATLAAEPKQCLSLQEAVRMSKELPATVARFADLEAWNRQRKRRKPGPSRRTRAEADPELRRCLKRAALEHDTAISDLMRGLVKNRLQNEGVRVMSCNRYKSRLAKCAKCLARRCLPCDTGCEDCAARDHPEEAS